MSELANYLIEATVYACLVFATFLWLRKHASYVVQRAWLLGGLLLSLCVPFIELGLAQDMGHWSLQLPAIQIDQPGGSAAASDFNIPWTTIIFSFYAIGVAIVGIRFFYGFVPLINYMSKGQKKEEKGIDFIYHSQVEVPFSFGPYVFWNPKWTYTEEQKRMILRHESVHIQKHHTWDILLLQVVKMLAWFHPLVYLFESSIKDIHEFEADQATLIDHTRKDYIELLLQHLFRARWVLGHSIFQSPIQKRIKMMKSNNNQKTNKGMMAVALILMLSSLVYLGCNETTVSSDEAVATEQINTTGENMPMDSSDEVFNKVEEMPRFPGCESINNAEEAALCSQQKMMNWIMSRIEYPEDARKNNASGQVLVKFVVDKEGKVLDPTIVKNMEYGMGEEVIRVVNQMNEMDERWTPGRQRDRNVNVELYLPVNFELSDQN